MLEVRRLQKKEEKRRGGERERGGGRGREEREREREGERQNCASPMSDECTVGENCSCWT